MSRSRIRLTRRKPSRPTCSAALRLKLPALAVTDQNNLFALVKFYKDAENVGIKPIAGADVLIAEGASTPSRMTLLCRDRDGYLSLSRLLTRAWMEGHRVEGVVAASGLAQAGATPVRDRRPQQPGRLFAIEVATTWPSSTRRLAAVFGERLHLELTRTGRDGEDAFNAFALLSAASAASRWSPATTCASWSRGFRRARSARLHRLRPRAGRPQAPARLQRRAVPQVGRRNGRAVRRHPRRNRQHRRAGRTLQPRTAPGHLLPARVPGAEDETLDSWICSESRKGLDARLEKNPLAEGKTRADYDERLELELDVIIKMGFPGYFLIVADFINWAKNQGIPVGPGRGSGAGSLVAWALRITDLDPLPYDLLFERFLNPERVSMPDFDIDFCMDRRDEVIDYVARKYGRDRVSQIITYGTMAAKAVVRDSGRVLGFPYGLVDGLAKLIPNILGISLEDAIGEGKDSEMASPELIQRYQTEDDVRDLIDLALQLEDLTRNAGKHAGGVVIAPNRWPSSARCSPNTTKAVAAATRSPSSTRTTSKRSAW